MRRHPSRAGLATCALALACAAAGALGQERFAERLTVTEVEVPVRVLVKGEPVGGLTRDDFVLFERGEPREILGFEVRSFALPAGPRGERPPAEEPVATAAGRRLLLLFDFSSSRPGRLARALDDLRPALPGLVGPDDRVAVATYGGISGLNLLTGFTGDSETLTLALDAVGAILDAKDARQRELLGELHRARFGSVETASTFENLSRELGAAAALAILAGDVVYDEAEDDGVTIDRQGSIFAPVKVRVDVDRTEPIRMMQDRLDGVSGVRSLGLALTELAYLLRELPGPKELLVLSEGFGGALLRDARALFYLEKALAAFRDAGWIVHGLDVKGLAGTDEGNFSADSLLFFADATGGELVESTNDFTRAAARVLERTAIVYVLTFQPADAAGRGELRQIEVKLARKIRGAKLVHRPGYTARRPPAKREVFERRIDGIEWLLGNQEAAELEVGVQAEVMRDPLGGTRVPFAVEVGGPSILSGGLERSSRIELQLLVSDAGGAVRGLAAGETVVDPRLSRAALAAGGVRFVGTLDLAPGDYQLRLLVRSHRRGDVTLRTLSLAVSADPEAAPSLPPLRAARSGAWRVVETETRSAYFR